MKYKFAEERPALLVGRAGRHDVVRIDGEEMVSAKIRQSQAVLCCVGKEGG